MASTAKRSTGPALVKDEPKPKSKPTKILPSDRVTFAKQLDILRGYASISAQGNKIVTNAAVSSITGMAPETISMCNAFFNSVGMIQKCDGGWTVSADVQSFFRSYDWNKETASYKLGPLVQASWFGEALVPRLRYQSMEEEAAIDILKDEATAGPEYKRALRMLIDCLESCGVIKRDGSQLKLRTMPEPNASQQDPTKSSEPHNEIATPQRPKVATNFAQLTQGAMRFNVSFDVDMSEMANWRPERITAFFNGIAQVLAAKAEVEKTAGV